MLLSDNHLKNAAKGTETTNTVERTSSVTSLGDTACIGCCSSSRALYLLVYQEVIHLGWAVMLQLFRTTLKWQLGCSKVQSCSFLRVKADS